MLDGGATIPFISRYRKEVTEGLDEVQIMSIEEQGKLTDELSARIQNTLNMTELEDIYLPYKLKCKMCATIAREKGLEGLVKLIMAQSNLDVENKTYSFFE